MDNTKKQNILIVHNYYQIPGGEDTVVANEKKMLEKHGHKVILYSRNNAELKQMSKFQKAFLPITTVFNPRTYRDIKRFQWFRRYIIFGYSVPVRLFIEMGIFVKIA